MTVFAEDAETENSTGFEDVPDDAWYTEAVEWALENHLINNMTQKTFKPNDPCVKKKAITWLWKVNGAELPETEEFLFEDIDERSVHALSASWALENNIAIGINCRHFGAEDSITRAEAITYLWRCSGRPDPRTGKQVFEDIPIDSIYYKAVMWAAESSIIQENEEEMFYPDKICTKAEYITFLYRSKVPHNFWGRPDENVSDLMIPGEEGELRNGEIYGNIYGVNPGSTPFMTAAKNMFTEHEGLYDTVAENDVGTCGGGFMGFRGDTFLAVLKIAVNKLGEDNAKRILGDDLYYEIVSEPDDSELWDSCRILSDEEARLIHRLLRTREGIAAEDEYGEFLIGKKRQEAINNHISSDAAILYYCAIANHYGSGGAQHFINLLKQDMGVDSGYEISSLEEFHNAVEAAAGHVSYIGSTIESRRRIYHYIKDVLGWS